MDPAWISFAPGSAITSSTMTSTNSYEAWDGTSMAAPHVAGAAALYLTGNPKASPAAVTAARVANSTKDVVSDPHGSPNRLLFVTSPLPAVVPVISAPSNGTVTRSPVLTWKSVNNANVYQVQLASDSAFTSPLAEGSGINPLQYSPTTITDGKWYWRVRAVDEDGNPGGWSAVRYFTYDSTPPLNPVLQLPLEGSTVIGTPTFKWAGSATTARYQFGYNTLNSSEPLLYSSLPVKTTSFKPPAMEDGTYYWFVRCIDAVGNMSGWGSAAVVHIRPLTPAAPTGLVLNSPSSKGYTNDTSPELSWKKVTYGSKYHVQIAYDTKFVNIEINTEAVYPGGTFTSPDLSEGKYYWRVQARNSEGTYGKYSTTGTFTIDTTPPLPPVLVSPSDNKLVAGTTTFSWKPSATAKYYQFGYGSGSDSVPTTLFPYPTTKTSYKPPAMSVGAHRWFAKAADQAGNWSDWSTFLTVIVDPTIPAKPSLTAPANGVVFANTEMIPLSWNPVLYGYKFNIQVDSHSNFSAPTNFVSAVDASSMNIGPLTGGKWYWRVQAENTKGGKSPWSSSRYFSVSMMDTEFNTNGNLEGWVPKAGAAWSVTGGYLTNPGTTDNYITSISYDTTVFNDLVIETRLKMADGAGGSGYGLMLRGDPSSLGSYNLWNDGYLVWIEQYSGSGSVSIYKYTSGTSTLVGYTYTSLVNYEDWNNVKVYLKGTTIKVYLDNNLLLTKTISGRTSGYIGLISETFENDTVPFYADWVRISRPE